MNAKRIRYFSLKEKESNNEQQKHEPSGRIPESSPKGSHRRYDFLTNGFQFKGIVKGFDSYIVILECDGKQNLVYKHAISTIIPIRPVSILESDSVE